MWKRYAYGWLTLAFFLVSIFGHWIFGWLAFVDEAVQHQQTPEIGQFAVQVARDTFESRQSEFLQLLWQVLGLAYFLYIGSPASKENDDRLEAKMDELLRLVGREHGDRLIAEIDRRYLRTEGHAKPHGHVDVGHE